MTLRLTATLLEQCFNSRDDSDLEIFLKDASVPCHQHLLQARCPALDTTALNLPENPSVVDELLRWVYTGKMALPLEAVGGDRIAQLAEMWGLRDLHAMRQRLLRSWRREPARGCVEEDLLRAYDQERLGKTWFLCEKVQEEDPHVYAGFLPLLIKASSFFGAMFSSRWADSSVNGSDVAVIKVGWDVSTMRRLIRFLHGGPSFIRDIQDLDQAIHCADFFGMPVLLAHCNTWIVEHLDRDTAPRLWSYVESQPRLRMNWLEDSIFQEDMLITADSECFDFHLQEFPMMVDGIRDGESWVPLYDLTPSLMYRLVASGSLDVSTALLKSVVANFVQQKVPPAEQKAMLQRMMPPEVLFNRELRDQVLGGCRLGVRGLM